MAGELGLLRAAELDWPGFKAANEDLDLGTEHFVELAAEESRVVKITIPPAFGLIPRVVRLPVVNLRDDPALPTFREAVEFLPATPLEYLERWAAANELFDDDVRLNSVVRWADGQVSFAISQPQYHGIPATHREIDAFFQAAGWKRLPDVSGHTLYFNYAFQVLAIDAMPRNCYLHPEGSLLPFDVILSRPDEALERVLGLW